MDLGDDQDRLAQVLRGAYRSSASGVELQLERPERPVYLDLERAIPCGLVVNELVTNAFKHAFPGQRTGTITIALSSGSDRLTLAVRDDGVGLPEGFDFDNVKSLGLQLVPLLVDQLHGTLQMVRDGGAHYLITFPAMFNVRGTP
jgi:two-component sensor histidine kinase